MVLSTFATQTLETVAAAAPDGVRWFQLYVHKDRGWTAELAARAADAGYRAIVLTVDVPVLGRRRRDERNGFALPPPLVLAHEPETTPRMGVLPSPRAARMRCAACSRGMPTSWPAPWACAALTAVDGVERDLVAAAPGSA